MNNPKTQIHNLIDQLNKDETQALLELTKRIVQGRKEYGPLDVSVNRDWIKDALEETIDLSLYLVFFLLQGRKRFTPPGATINLTDE